MVAYTKPQHRKKEESEQLRERDKIKIIVIVVIFLSSTPVLPSHLARRTAQLG